MRRGALGVIFGSMLVMGLGYAAAFLPGDPQSSVALAFAVAIAAAITGFMVLGAARQGRLRRGLAVLFGMTFLTLAGGFYAALRDDVANSDRLILGVPAGAAIILYIVGLLPLLVLPIAYALTFDEPKR